MGARLIRWRVSWVWYALALAVPLAVKFASIGLNSALGAPAPAIAEFNVWYSLPMAIAINIVNPLNAQLPEEASFRGWAQPKLQTTRTPLAATVLMAVGVTIWHIPLFLMPQFGSSPIEAAATVAVTFWYAWLFNHASGSSLLTLIAHATEGTIETSTLWQASADTTRMTWLYSLTWCLVALVLLVFDRRFWTRPPSTTPNVDRVTEPIGTRSLTRGGSPVNSCTQDDQLTRFLSVPTYVELASCPFVGRSRPGRPEQSSAPSAMRRAGPTAMTFRE